ncbi:MAG TPA: universal stress protein [Kofleriaceae bacterium]|jgi:nucleotide-binding universal stress UspA family protein|nr:universal stress protein [Kofleriaceae bacterium]
MEPRRKLLLATDLTARSDRATDRAVQLGTEAGAHVVALHVLEVDRPAHETGTGPAQRARQALQFDLAPVGDGLQIEVERGDPAERVLDVAHSHGCGLIVTGVARAERLGTTTLGKTVDRLLRTSDVPLLIVTDRPRRPYQQIVVAVDFSDASRVAVETAARWFPGSPLTVFHAYDAPPVAAVTDPHRLHDEFRAAAQSSYAAFARDLAATGSLMPMLRRGEPDQLLRELVAREASDLVVLGTHGRGRLFDALIGSVARRIVTRLPCDALIVPHRR